MPSFPSDRWTHIDTLFEAALERPPDERTAFLRAACGDDPVIYREVEALLAIVHESAQAFGESAEDFAAPLLASAPPPDGTDAEDPALGTVVGPYQILRELGRGGMGTVYLASRADGTFEKEVALKLVKRGMDTDEVLRRFRRERQILAGLEHPGIARLVDGGAAADGRPFLVMEVVHGAPLTSWADERTLRVDERLDLFLRVAEAVAYAHQRLVIHRDLKPSNILVAQDGTVKLLDFGIARLLEDEDEGLLTRTGHHRLTPAYAAPEQLHGEAVTTATDVYALGVIGYELLAGVRPHDVTGKGIDELKHLLAEAPPRPSTVLGLAAAAARGTTPERLMRRLRGDLDTILLKALHADPARRYPSVQALMDDLHRHQDGQPVRARSDTAGYRLRKFVRRNRIMVGAMAAVAVALVGGLGVAMWQASVAERERDIAQTEAATAEEVSAFLEELLASTDPNAPERMDTLRVADLLARGTAQLGDRLHDQPLVRARLLHTLGRIHSKLSLDAAAQALLREALALRETHQGSEHPETLTTRLELGSELREDRAFDEAAPLIEEALRGRQALWGEAHPAVAEALIEAGLLRQWSDDPAQFAEVPSYYERALAIRTHTFGPSHPDVAEVLVLLGGYALEEGDYAASRSHYTEALAIYRLAYGAEHPRVTEVLHFLAFLALTVGDLEDAERYSEEEVRLARAVYRPDNARLAAILTQRGVVLRRQGFHVEAEAILKEALAMPRRDSLYRANVLGALASVWMEQGRLGEAEAAQRETVTILQVNPSTSPAVLLGPLLKHATILQRLGRFAEAEQVLTGASRLGTTPLGAAYRPAIRTAFADLYVAWGRPGEAARWRTSTE